MILSLLTVGFALAQAPRPAEPDPPVEPVAPVVDPVTARAFGDHLLGAGDAFNALTWYRLALFLDPSGAEAETLRFRVALAYERGERWEAAAFSYGQLVGGDLAAQAAYRAALCEHRAGLAAVAERDLSVLVLDHPDSDWARLAPYTLGVLALRDHDLAGAATHFAAVPATVGEPLALRAATLSSAAAEPLKRKSPVLAGTLSIVPGLGQLYGGHPGDALMALLVNGASGLAAATLLADGIEDDRAWEIAAGSAFAAGFLITWPSSILGAARGAQRTNQHRARRRSEALLQQAWTPELELEAEAVDLP